MEAERTRGVPATKWVGRAINLLSAHVQVHAGNPDATPQVRTIRAVQGALRRIRGAKAIELQMDQGQLSLPGEFRVSLAEVIDTGRETTQNAPEPQATYARQATEFLEAMQIPMKLAGIDPHDRIAVPIPKTRTHEVFNAQTIQRKTQSREPEGITLVKEDEKGSSLYEIYEELVILGPIETRVLRWFFDNADDLRDNKNQANIADIAPNIFIPTRKVKEAIIAMRAKNRGQTKIRQLLKLQGDVITYSPLQPQQEE